MSPANAALQEVFEDEATEYDGVLKPSEMFKFKTKPMKHQVEYFDICEVEPKNLNGDDQGLGKTKQAIDVAVWRKQNYGLKHCLIVCGVNDLKYNWIKEIALHSDESYYLLGERRGGWGKIYPGCTKDKIEDLDKIENGEIDAFFIITNIEALRSQEMKDKVFELTNTGTINMCVVDEIHKACNAESKQGKSVNFMQSYYRMALTGTPFMNRVTDLFVVLQWLGKEINTFHYFKTRYCIFGGTKGYAIKGVQNLRELNMKLNSVMTRRIKSEALKDLPKKIRQIEYVTMGPQQEKIYKEIKLQIMANIQNIKLNPNPLSMLIRLRQATGWTGILSTTIQESAKMDRMVELVDEITHMNELQYFRGEKRRKVIIFSNWVQMTDVIKTKLQKHNPAVVTGDTKDKMKEIDRFMNDDNCHAIIGTIKALGTGFNLFRAGVVIFMDEPWNDSNKKQAEDRAHRIGVEAVVDSITLITRDTIDMRINEIVEEKAELNEGVVEGDEDVIYKLNIDTESLVDRLLS